MKRQKYIGKALVVLLFLCLIIPNPITSADIPDLKLAISFQDGEQKIAGVRYDIYLVAKEGADGSLKSTEAFSNYPINYKESDPNRLATTLEGYVIRDQIEPYDSSITDEEGMAYFPSQGKSLEEGLYLVMGKEVTIRTNTYKPVSFLVSLPYENIKTRELDNIVEVEAKYEIEPAVEYEVDKKVIKIWKDQGHKEERPASIEIQLIGNGEIYDTVTLNADNNWEYNWEKLDGRVEWKVTEAAIEDYSVEITQEGDSFIVVNTYEEEKTTTEEEKHEPTTETEREGRLPQTGQLWWPAAALAVAGLFFITIGLALGVWDDKHKK